jgi:hypothetical protein
MCLYEAGKGKRLRFGVGGSDGMIGNGSITCTQELRCVALSLLQINVIAALSLLQNNTTHFKNADVGMCERLRIRYR